MKMEEHNLGVALAVHSYKGGTGKSLVSTNLAAIFASQGKKVCLIDLDLRAPSLNVAFNVRERKFWINDFLNDKCKAEEAVFSASVKGLEGRLLLALANPSMDAIRDTVTKDKKWEMHALRKLVSLKNYLMENQGAGYVIFDTSPGVGYSSINAIAVSDVVLVVSTWDNSDASGTQGMINELYKLLEKKAVVLINKIPEQLLIDESTRKRLTEQFKSAFRLPIIDLLPCYCEVLRRERSSIITLEDPNHPFSKSLVRVAEQIQRI
jgi:septum site-determining protein MinD